MNSLHDVFIRVCPWQLINKLILSLNFYWNQEKLKQEMQTVKVSQIMEFCCCLFFLQGAAVPSIYCIVLLLPECIGRLKEWNYLMDVVIFQDSQAVLASVQKEVQRLEMELDSSNREKVWVLRFLCFKCSAKFAQIIFSLSSQDFSNWLGLCHMYYVFYRLIYEQLTLESWFTNLEQVPLNNSLSTVTSAIQKTYWRTQAKLTTRQ